MNIDIKFAATLTQRIEKLAGYVPLLKQYPHDDALRRDTCYSATHVARAATELFYQQNFQGVRDVAPGLKPHGAHANHRLQQHVRILLKQVLRPDMVWNSNDPLNRLARTLRDDEPEPLSLAVVTTQAAVALLGMHELGGVYAAWQVGVLAFTQPDWSSWEHDWSEYVVFNQHILAHAMELEPQTAIETSQHYELPGLPFLRAGCHGNIAKAAYRIFALTEQAALRQQAQQIGNDAMTAIESMFDEATHRMLLFDTMRAMRVACAAGTTEYDTDFWSRFTTNEIVELLKTLKKIEPCEPLVRLVQQSAKQHVEQV